MQIEGTRAAFETLISERGIYKRLGVERSTVATWKIYLREGKSISLDKMEEMLIRSGATVVQDKAWEIKESSDNELLTGVLSSIRPADVRIGNYLKTIYHGEKVIQVDMNVMVSLTIPNGTVYKPVLITEEWLINLGLENREGGVADSWHIGNNPVTHDWLFEIVHIKDDGRYFYRNAYNKIKFVHQLQNLYFTLTGNELTIK